MCMTFCPQFSGSFLLGVCTMNSKTTYKLSPSNKRIKQTSNDHGIIQQLFLIKESMPMHDSWSS